MPVVQGIPWSGLLEKGWVERSRGLKRRKRGGSGVRVARGKLG